MKDEKQQELFYEEKDLILFEEGLFGFEEYTKYIPLAVDDEDESGMMIYLQSVEEEHLSFLMMNPLMLMKNYAPVLSEDDLKALDAKEAGELAYYVICVMKETPQDSTVNLKCPVAINVNSKKARQVILEEGGYGMRHTLKEFSDKEGA